MPTTDDEFAVAQAWIGTWEDKAAFDERYDRLGDIDDAIVESMRAYRAELVSQASTIQVEDISMTFTENIRSLDRMLAEFTDVGGVEETATAVNVTKLVRSRYR